MKVLNLYTVAKHTTKLTIHDIKNNNMDCLILTDDVSLSFDDNIKNALQITINIDNDFKKKSYESVLYNTSDLAWSKENHHGINWYYFNKQYLNSNIVCVNDISKSDFINTIKRNV